MRKGFRDFLDDLEQAGQMCRLAKPVDPRQLSGLVSHSDKAAFFESIDGYPDWCAVGGLVSTRERLAIAMKCSEDTVGARFEEALENQIAPEIVGNAPCQEVVHTGDDVDLTAIPYPMMHVFDGGPYISGTFVASSDPEYGRNYGSYRLMYRTPARDRHRPGVAVGHADVLPARAGPG